MTSDENNSKKQAPAFLEKLFDILEDNNSYSHLISWQPDGVSFLIKRVNEFSEVVLPKYFKHSNIQSYIRQLNMYGFSKTRHDSNHREFTHKLFRRGRRDLLPYIKRKTQLTSRSNPAQSTDDYRLPACRSSSPVGNSAKDKDDIGIMEVNECGTEYLEIRVEKLESSLCFILREFQQLNTKYNMLCDELEMYKSAVTSKRKEECSTSYYSSGVANCLEPSKLGKRDSNYVASDASISSESTHQSGKSCGDASRSLSPESKRIKMLPPPKNNLPLSSSTGLVDTVTLESDASSEPQDQNITTAGTPLIRQSSFVVESDDKKQKAVQNSNYNKSIKSQFSSFKVADLSDAIEKLLQSLDYNNRIYSTTLKESDSTATGMEVLKVHGKGTVADVHDFYSRLRSNSIDIGGLAAITAAADILDQAPKSNSQIQTSIKNSINSDIKYHFPYDKSGEQNHSRERSRNNGNSNMEVATKSPTSTMVVPSTMVLPSSTGGKPILKAYSFGPGRTYS